MLIRFAWYLKPCGTFSLLYNIYLLFKIFTSYLQHLVSHNFLNLMHILKTFLQQHYNN